MTTPTLAERVAERLLQNGRVTRIVTADGYSAPKIHATFSALAEFVLAADELERHEDVYLQSEARYDAALAVLAKALGVDE